MKILSHIALLTLLLTVAVRAETPEEWSHLLTPTQVTQRLQDPATLVIDARSEKEYAQGHIPGAINIPGKLWRTPSAEAGKGDSQYFFRTADGSVDLDRYVALLSEHGVRSEDRVIVYGNHAGKADGSVPALVLDALGHKEIAFLDGVGLNEWAEDQLEVQTEAIVRQPSHYAAAPREHFIWNLPDVLAHVGDPSVLFYDTRSADEYSGKDLRDNARGGHIPGAVLLDYADFLTSTKTTKSPAAVQALLDAKGITTDKTLVLYCQTATRVSLPVLVLRDLGYEKIAIYDASWHEYGNRQDTPIEN